MLVYNFNYLFKEAERRMTMSYLKELMALEDKNGLRLCVHEWLDFGKIDLTVYRIIKENEDRQQPIPNPVLTELNLILKEYFGSKPGGLEKLKHFITGKIADQSFVFRVFETGLTESEIREKQASWNAHCETTNV